MQIRSGHINCKLTKQMINGWVSGSYGLHHMTNLPLATQMYQPTVTITI